ncbi:MAG: hypothetical protein E7640_00500 [Ruminococcaceae bacterium]|nr:hypothetical protein [Oscillospiraceae bacterium]
MATFQNRATLTYNNFVTNSNTVTGEIVEALSAAKNAVDATYASGEDITYVVSIVNSGTTPFTGLTVTDDLGRYTVGTGPVTATPLTFVDGSVALYVNGVLSTTPTVTGTDPLTFTGITVPAGGNAVLIYRARVNEFAPLGTDATIVNTATVTGNGLPSPVTAEATVTATAAPFLTITKALTPTVVRDNGQITYTFVIQNLGNTAAEIGDNVTVTDTFDPIIDITAVTLDGVTLTSPTDYTYDTTTGEFATVPGRITVPSATYTQDPTTGEFTTVPGTATLTVSGTI